MSADVENEAQTQAQDALSILSGLPTPLQSGNIIVIALSGDTLQTIIARALPSLAQTQAIQDYVQRLNQISNASAIYPGQIIRIPRNVAILASTSGGQLS